MFVVLCTAQEASWEQVFDLIYTLLFDLYHELRSEALSDFHPFERAGVEVRWFLVDGFDTCWIPRSFSCGM